MLIGVAPDGKLVGQDVADIPLRDIAATLGRFEPLARVEMSRVDVGSGRQVVVLEAAPSRQFAPFVFESKPHKRGSRPSHGPPERRCERSSAIHRHCAG